MENLVINLYKQYLIIWHNPQKNTYYSKYVTGCYKDYYVGYKNSYDHEIILIIKISYEIPRFNPIKTLIKKLISLLYKIERRL